MVILLSKFWPFCGFCLNSVFVAVCPRPSSFFHLICHFHLHTPYNHWRLDPPFFSADCRLKKNFFLKWVPPVLDNAADKLWLLLSNRYTYTVLLNLGRLSYTEIHMHTHTGSGQSINIFSSLPYYPQKTHYILLYLILCLSSVLHSRWYYDEGACGWMWPLESCYSCQSYVPKMLVPSHDWPMWYRGN